MSDSANPLRVWRRKEGKSLDWLADQIGKRCGDRPSKAKLSRIETDKQPLPVELVPHAAAITGLTAKQLRPDLADVFTAGAKA